MSFEDFQTCFTHWFLAVVLVVSVSFAFFVDGSVSALGTGVQLAQPEMLTTAGEQTQSEGSILDGIFTSSQASRGEQTFREVCAACHDTSEFSGGRFRLNWVGRTAGELFDTLVTLMPEGDPGSLSPDVYASLVAYFFKLNGYPTGGVALPPDLAKLQRVFIVESP